MRTIRLMTGRIYLMVSALINGGILAENGDQLTTEASEPIITEQA